MNDLYSRMGIDIDKLGCVMLDCETPTEMLDLVPDFFWYHDPERPDDFGPELDSHVTLLFGLLTPAHQQREFVDEVLADWRQPEVFEVGTKWGLDVFGPKGAPYEAIVLKPAMGSPYIAANDALSRLPHVRTFPRYAPHVTLGYVNSGASKYVIPDLADALAKRQKRLQLVHTGLNYGRED